jgi:hypothetical protein
VRPEVDLERVAARRDDLVRLPGPGDEQVTRAKIVFPPGNDERAGAISDVTTLDERVHVQVVPPPLPAEHPAIKQFRSDPTHRRGNLQVADVIERFVHRYAAPRTDALQFFHLPACGGVHPMKNISRGESRHGEARILTCYRSR